MAELTDADVGLAPPQARPAGPVEFSDADVGLAPAPQPAARSPIASAFAGAPLTEPQLDPAAPATTAGDRFAANFKEGFDSTFAGEVVNRVQSGQNAQAAADDMARAILDARNKGSEFALDTLSNGKPNPYAQMPVADLEPMFQRTFADAQKRREGYGAAREAQKAELDAINPWYTEPTLIGKALAGVTALGGEVAGSALSPENFIGGFGGGVVRAPGESLLRYGARRVAPGAAEGAVGGGVADPAVQAGRVARGEQEGFDPLQTAQSVVLGAAVGGSFRMSGMLWDALRKSRAKSGAPDIAPEQVTPDDVLNQLQVDPEFAALARANGVDPFSTDPRNAVLQERLTRRRIEEQLRPTDESVPVAPGEFKVRGENGATSAEIARRQNEKAGVEAGDIDPAATNMVPRAPDQRPIMVDSQGGAYRADPGAEQGRAKAEILGGAAQRALPAPGREVPTDAEIARQRAAAEGGNQPTVEAPPRLMGSEDRAPQTSADVEGQRQAGEAFTLADRQRGRAGSDVADTQVAGRPEGRGEQAVHLDEGHPVEILSRRMVPDGTGKMVEVARVRRTDPRTGAAMADAVEYEVPVRQLTTSRYAPEPRMAQDFETRAEVAKGPAGRMDDSQGLPRQTYRTTEPDPNPSESGRWTRPEQPDGPGPGRPWSSYEEAMRDFADRQARGQTEPPRGGPDYSKAKASNQARGKDRDGRFVVDENGHVMSSAEGPIRFADQKQAAKWILNVGQKQSPDQIFEIAVHPSGKGFTARERGRSERPQEPPKGGPTRGARPEAPQQQQRPAGPPPQLEGPRAEAPPAEAPRAATPPPRAPAPEPEVPRPTTSAFQERLNARANDLLDQEIANGPKRKDGQADKRGYFSRESYSRHKMMQETARYDLMREDAADHIDWYRREQKVDLNDEQLGEISRFYNPRDGEAPAAAFDRALDRWFGNEERRALQELGMDDIFMPPESRGPYETTDWRGNTVFHPGKEGFDFRPEANPRVEEDIPFETGNARAADSPRQVDGGQARGEGQGEPGPRRGAEQDGAQPAERSGGDGGRFGTDAGPDGGRQTVIPGAERIGDRQLAERRGQQPLRGGNEAPPAGGLFDADARAQTDMFDAPPKKAPVGDAEKIRVGQEKFNEAADRLTTPDDWEPIAVGDRVANVYDGKIGVVQDGDKMRDPFVVKMDDGGITVLPGDRWIKLDGAPVAPKKTVNAAGIAVGDTVSNIKTGASGTVVSVTKGNMRVDTGRGAPVLLYNRDVVKVDRPKGGDGPKFYSNPFFAPEAWAGLAKSLGVHADYFKDLRASFNTWKQSRLDTSGKKTNTLADIGRSLIYSTDGELRAIGQVYKSQTIKKIADMLFAPADVGRGGAVSRTYHEAVEQRTISNLNKVAETLRDFRDKPDQLNQIRQLVQNPGGIRAGTPIHDAAIKIRNLLDDEFRYLNEAGVKIESNIKGYFPRIVDAEAVLRNPADFLESAAKQYLRDRIASNRTEADKLAKAWLASIELGHAGAKKDGTDFVMLGGTPNSDFRKERVFGRSLEADKGNPLAKYYMQDPIDVLTLHFQRTARRAEWARRFGDDLETWKKLKQDIIDEGNVASLRQVVDAIAVATGTQRAYQSDAARSAVGFLRTWGAIKLLPRATITSLSETAMPAIRSGDLTRVLGDMVRTTKALAGGMEHEREIAADLGLISHAIGDSVLGRRYFALEPGSKVQQDIINRYFRRTGLEQLTNAQRVVAVAAGQTFLRRLAKDVAGDGRRAKSSTAYLRELGIEDAKGFSEWLNGVNDGMPALGDIRADEGFSGAYRTALQRFNQQTSLNPNASTRPKWANHPLGSLAFMLQSYAYAFQKQVLNRAGAGIREGLTGSGYTVADRATMLAPAMALPALAAIQWGLQEPRDAVFGDPSSKKKEPHDVFMQVLSRSGLTGILDPYINMATGARYDRDAATAIAGPVGGGVASLIDSGLKLAVKNADTTNTAERNFTKAAYDATLMPAAAVLAGFLPAPVGAAVIQGASSGAAREAFTEAVAGPKANPFGPKPPRPPKPPTPGRH